MIAFDSPAAFAAALADLPEPDLSAQEAAIQRQMVLTKPAGALGRLEDIAIFLAGWAGQPIPAIDPVQAIVFAGNHGVVRQGISAFPPEVTVQMVANFQAGGAAINALCRNAGAALSVVALDLDRPTADMTQDPAMSVAECLDALNRGAAAVQADTRLLLVGEMGIGNTTPAAALCAHVLSGGAAQWVGRGSGIDDAALNRKITAVDTALRRHAQSATDAFETLRRLGGREIAAMAGAILAARLQRIPVLLDGFIATSAVVPLARDNMRFTNHCIAAHCSAEAAHGQVLERLGLEPLLRLGLRLGEGSGAALAVPIVRAACAAHAEMATFAQAGVANGG